MRSCSILIPAKDERSTIAAVVGPALEAGLGPVLVVDDGSVDNTAAVARAAGARVLRLEANRGKGGAVWAGAGALSCDVLVLLDADLTGLTPQHVRDLAAPVLEGRAVMSRGVFAGGRWRTTTAQRLTPQLNGQRAVLREKLMGVEHLAGSRYGVEVVITRQARRERWPVVDVPMVGVSQVMKEEKRGWFLGGWIRLRMYQDILRAWLRRRSPR